MGFKGVSLQSSLVEEVEALIKENPVYRSVAEFISEATRLRLEALKKKHPVPVEVPTQ